MGNDFLEVGRGSSKGVAVSEKLELAYLILSISGIFGWVFLVCWICIEKLDWDNTPAIFGVILSPSIVWAIYTVATAP